MAVAMLGLSACTKPAPKPQPQPTPEVPTAEGKITFYFEMGQQEDAVAVPEWASVYLTGAFAGWATDSAEVVTFQQLEGTNIWYGQYEKDYTTIDDFGYQLTMGYAADSGAPTTGVNWSYKSVECQAASGESGVENANFELSADGLTANLGSHHWDAAPGAVKIASNIDVQITLAEALPEYVALYAPGNFRNNWSCSPTDDKMTPSEDRKTWSIHIDSITVGTYDMKIIAEYADCTSFSWGTTVLDNGDGGNYALMVLTGDTDGTIDINDMESVEAYTVDLSKLPDPSTLTKLEMTLNVAFEKMPEGFPETWWVCGTMNGWDGSTTHVFSWAENDFSMSIKFEVNSDTEYEFGIVAASNWAPSIKSAEGQNHKVAVASESVVVNYVVEEDQVDVIMENGEAKVKGEDTPVEALLELTAANLLGYTGEQIAYSDGTAKVDEIDLSYEEMACYGNGIQMRTKNGKSSKLWNTTALGEIHTVTFTPDESKTSYVNEGAFIVEFATQADFSDAVSVTLDSAAGEPYTATNTLAGATYFRFTHNITYTLYIGSIVVA